MPYKTNLKLQTTYALTSAITALVVIYVLLGKWEWLTVALIGLANFIAAGFYGSWKCK